VLIFKPIQIKMQTDLKEIKTVKNWIFLHVFGCSFCENRRFGLDFRLIFQNRSKLNQTTCIYFNTYLTFY
jgi:hypothetical protein